MLKWSGNRNIHLKTDDLCVQANTERTQLVSVPYSISFVPESDYMDTGISLQTDMPVYSIIKDAVKYSFSFCLYTQFELTSSRRSFDYPPDGNN